MAGALREIEHMLIPLRDGTQLAARIWLPEDAQEPGAGHPRISAVPQARRHYQRDALTHPYLAGHGYAAVRVDIRGSGESDGLLFDEYAQQEQDDALEVIAWLARAALVQRRGRHDGHLLGRLQRACRSPRAARRR